MSVSSAAFGGNRLELLLALRTRLATAIDDAECPARDLAALTRRLMDVAKEIAELQERIKQEAGEAGNGNGKKWDVANV